MLESLDFSVKSAKIKSGFTYFISFFEKKTGRPAFLDLNHKKKCCKKKRTNVFSDFSVTKNANSNLIAVLGCGNLFLLVCEIA